MYYQPNPCKRSVGDCAVRAISKALGISWKRAYSLLAEEGYSVCDMPSSDAVWGAVLRRHGFKKRMITKDGYTAHDFCLDHPDSGVCVLAYGGHVATAISGFVYDSWNSTHSTIQYYYEMEE